MNFKRIIPLFLPPPPPYVIIFDYIHFFNILFFIYLAGFPA